MAFFVHCKKSSRQTDHRAFASTEWAMITSLRVTVWQKWQSALNLPQQTESRVRGGFKGLLQTVGLRGNEKFGWLHQESANYDHYLDTSIYLPVVLWLLLTQLSSCNGDLIKPKILTIWPCTEKVWWLDREQVRLDICHTKAHNHNIRK